MSPKVEAIPNLRKNLEFLEENIENKRIEMELSNNLVKVQLWVDYTKKYGIGYRLTNGAVGVLFNDLTTLIFSHPISKYSEVTYIP